MKQQITRVSVTHASKAIAALCALISLALVATSSAATNKLSRAAAKSSTPVKIGKLVFEGGDGSSMEKAVVIKNAKGEEEGVAAEDKWIKKVHPGWKKGAQALLNDNGKNYDRIEYATAKGETKTIFFDISDFFGK